jgi:hypothetical protein
MSQALILAYKIYLRLSIMNTICIGMTNIYLDTILLIYKEYSKHYKLIDPFKMTSPSKAFVSRDNKQKPSHCCEQKYFYNS